MELNKYKQLIEIVMKDGTIHYSDADMKQFTEYVEIHKFVTINGRLYNTFEIITAGVQKLDDVNSYIMSFGEGRIKEKLLEKKERLKKEMNKHMTLDYAKNYVSNLNSK